MQYRVLQKSFIGNRIVEEGEIIEYDGEPGKNLEPVKSRRKAADTAETSGASAGSSGAGDNLV